MKTKKNINLKGDIVSRIEVKTKRTHKTETSAKGMLVFDGELKLVQMNDYGEIIAELTLAEAFDDFIGQDVKIKIDELAPDVEEELKDVTYLE